MWGFILHAWQSLSLPRRRQANSATAPFRPKLWPECRQSRQNAIHKLLYMPLAHSLGRATRLGLKQPHVLMHTCTRCMYLLYRVWYMHILREKREKLLTLITQIERNLLLHAACPQGVFLSPFPVYVLAADTQLIKRPKCLQFCTY